MPLDQPAADRLGDRERLVAVADVDLDLAAPQAGGDLDRLQLHPAGLHLPQALGDLRLRHAEHPHRVAAQRRRPARAARRTGSVSSAAAHIGCSSRGGPGQDDHDPLARRHDQPRRRPHRVERHRALGNHRLLAVRLQQRLLVELEALRRSR